MLDMYASFDDDVDTSERYLRKQCTEKVNADPDEIDISSMTASWKRTIILKLLKRKILEYHLLLHCRC